MSLPAPLALALAPLAACPAPDAAELPWKLAAPSWRTDAVWHDGLSERCVYEATRVIYGEERSYVARAYTNEQHMDPETTVKADGAEGVAVFKHHWSERVPTENYDYDFATTCFLRASDLATFKLTAATQEDCGSSFKQVWRDGDGLRWLESVYLPGTGLAEGELSGSVLLQDALPLVLRDFPFESPTGTRFPVQLVPSQKSTGSVPFAPRRFELSHVGRETVELPSLGAVEAHRVDLLDEDGERVGRYWLAAEGAAPWLHVLVRYEGADGTSYRLREIERTAYWFRG